MGRPIACQNVVVLFDYHKERMATSDESKTEGSRNATNRESSIRTCNRVLPLESRIPAKILQIEIPQCSLGKICVLDISSNKARSCQYSVLEYGSPKGTSLEVSPVYYCIRKVRLVKFRIFSERHEVTKKLLYKDDFQYFTTNVPVCNPQSSDGRTTYLADIPY